MVPELIAFIKSHVPAYLRDSDFYKSLVDNDGPVQVPFAVYKVNTSVQNASDLRHLLSTLRFWVVPYIPASLLEYCIRNQLHVYREVLREFREDLKYLVFLKILREKMDNESFVAPLENCKLNTEVNEGTAELCFLQYNLSDGRMWDSDSCALAVQHYALHVLKFLHEHGCAWDSKTCAEAAATDQLDCLKYAHENGCPWDVDTCASAASRDSIECLRYAHEQGCAWDSSSVIPGSQTECARYARTMHCPLPDGYCADAARRGDLVQLTENHEAGRNWDHSTCDEAALTGNLPCLQYAHEQGYLWDEHTCLFAAYYSLECLKYAHEHFCPWDERTTHAAVMTNNLRALQYAHEHDCPWDVYTFILAVEFCREPDLAVVEYLCANNCPWDPSVVCESGAIWATERPPAPPRV